MKGWKLAALAALLVLALPTASAHAEFRASTPSPGARLQEAPTSVSVTLTEQVDAAGTGLAVTNATGARFEHGDLRIQQGSQPTISIDLKPQVPPGVYTIRWHALSGADGHPSQGTLGFAIGNYTAPGAESQSQGKLQPAVSLTKTLAYAGLSLALGAAALLAWQSSGYPATLARRGILSGAILNAVGVALYMLATAGAAGLTLAKLLQSDVGRIILLRLLAALSALGFATLAARRPNRAWTPAATLLLLASAVASSRLGHPYAGGWAPMALDFLHLVSAAVWVGGLLLLLWLLWRGAKGTLPREDARRIGIRFGRLALACVATLAATGILVAAYVIGGGTLADPATLLASPYGAFLGGKVALALAMVALAGINRYILLADPAKTGLAGFAQRMAGRVGLKRLRPALENPLQFRATLAIEATLGMAVLVLAGFLTSTSPPAGAAPALGDLHLREEGANYDVAATFIPAPQIGHGSFVHLSITDLATHAPLVNNTCGSQSCVRLTIGYAGANGTEPHVLIPAGGIWLAHDILWSIAGPARIEVTIRSAEVFKDTVTFTVVVTDASGATPVPPAAQDVDVLLHDNPFHLLPEARTVPVGSEVRFHVRNAGSIPHDFRVCNTPAKGGCESPLGFTPILAPGQSANLTIRADTVGDHEYRCNIPGHAEAGMRGILTVATGNTGTKPTPALPAAALAVAVLALARRRRP